VRRAFAVGGEGDQYLEELIVALALENGLLWLQGVHSHMIVNEEADYEALVELIEAEDPMGSLI